MLNMYLPSLYWWCLFHPLQWQVIHHVVKQDHHLVHTLTLASVCVQIDILVTYHNLFMMNTLILSICLGMWSQTLLWNCWYCAVLWSLHATYQSQRYFNAIHHIDQAFQCHFWWLRLWFYAYYSALSLCFVHTSTIVVKRLFFDDDVK